jgi:mannose/fructose/N-acetylgalactosamine-specific phosphotransferase system component IIC
MDTRTRAIDAVGPAALGWGTLGGVLAGSLTWAVWIVFMLVAKRDAGMLPGLLATPIAAFVGGIVAFPLSVVWAVMLRTSASRSQQAPIDVANRLQLVSVALMSVVIVLVNVLVVTREGASFVDALPWMGSADVVALLTANWVGYRVGRSYLRTYEAPTSEPPF